jgi:hypothetical protein
VRRGFVNFRHERTVRTVRNRRCRDDGNLLQRRQFRESRGIGAQLGHADVLHVLEQTRLMIQEQKQCIRRIQERLAAAGSVLDPVVNRVFAVGHKDVVSIIHDLSFCVFWFEFLLVRDW